VPKWIQFLLTRGDSLASESPLSPVCLSSIAREPTLTLTLGVGDFGREIRLKTVSFQRVNSLHVFFDGNGAKNTVACIGCALIFSLEYAHLSNIVPVQENTQA
jgi:hypothetical protein